MSRTATRGKPWTVSELRRLRALYPTHSQAETAKLLPGRTPKAVASRAKVLGIKRIRNYRPWLPHDKARLRKIFADLANADVARILGRSISSVIGEAGKQGLHKSKKHMRRLLELEAHRLRIAGVAHRFQKGIVPANKGLRRPGWHAGRMRETQFKKGQKPHTWLPVGTVKFNADGYPVRKISDLPNAGHGALNRNWEFVHKRAWEDAHGPIPKGHRIWWKDGNHANCALENLELLSDKAHMARTTIHNPDRYPPDLKRAIMMAGALKRKIREKTEQAIEEAIA